MKRTSRNKIHRTQLYTPNAQKGGRGRKLIKDGSPKLRGRARPFRNLFDFVRDLLTTLICVCILVAICLVWAPFGLNFVVLGNLLVWCWSLWARLGSILICLFIDILPVVTRSCQSTSSRPLDTLVERTLHTKATSTPEL